MVNLYLNSETIISQGLRSGNGFIGGGGWKERKKKKSQVSNLPQQLEFSRIPSYQEADSRVTS